ncbi:prolyl oligopeptidase family serine peptidase [Chryseobacterium sp. Ch-15]|uniref:Prolyl oligopeptidase family serine peptidase n=1 Tax=Chryseobacterium muglaense TaxID=2893752 RepID=A0A9Q3UT67_9FLAO|nr:prolyl oligopeptidase family serine peptidase [Chryseobacterium muglaense]MBD3906892.1 S9 family peptidase [Chryseobacterium muglaense]MCC9033046.1 prolyl oligopeptidase family serine peptidase [Chryseobacterium muglaense]MCM2556616.1 prolyl oligopeptidase family serine peptidase [Chryseobacterium muglaense]
MAIALLIVQFHWSFARVDNDSLEAVMDRYYRPHLLAFSPKGHWAIAEKRYGRSSDTAMVYGAQGNGKIMGSVINMKVSRTFLKEEALLSSGVGIAEYWNLITGKKNQFRNLKRTTGLSETGTFCLLGNNGNAVVYDISGKLRYSIPNVNGYTISDGLKRTFVKASNDGYSEIYDLSGIAPVKIYSTKQELGHVQMSDRNTYLIATEYNQDTNINKVFIFNTITKKTNTFDIPELKREDFPAFTEMDDGLSLMMKVQRAIQKSKMVEIWYGNDGNLLNTEKGYDNNVLNWIINLQSDSIEIIPTIPRQQFLPSGNGQHFFSFIKGEVQDYRTLNEHVKMSVYDRLSKSYSTLDTIKNADLYLSNHGNITVYRTLDKKWNYYDLLTHKKIVIGGSNFRNPTFSADDKLVYFESDDGLYVFTPSKNITELISETGGHQAEIVNKNKTSSNVGNIHFYRIVLEKNKPLVLKMWNERENTTSYHFYKKGKRTVIIPTNHNHIPAAFFTKDGQKVVFVEENYTKSPRIIYKDLQSSNKKNTILDESHDAQSAKYRQEIIRYTNSDGKPLKGILYYPAQFDPKRKYPMVVKIYQVQSDISNHYHTIGYSSYIGFDQRLLVEKGYFVFLPDIVYGKQGTGLSALDCVHQSLDAVLAETSIDSSKIGLIGHSHGGYETNFIATHSKRFAAYHSGAGNSDIVRSYFSYNYNFNSPFYWQYEDGQYDMPSSFAHNKEVYFRNNPIHYSDQVNAPILLWAGKKDKNIVWDQVMEFYVGLKRNQKDVIALFYPNQGHALGATGAERKDLYYRSLEWWDYFLKNKKDVSWIDLQMVKK